MVGEKLFVVAILAIMLLPGCIFNSGDSGAISVKIISVGEKDMVCRFGEPITLNVTAKSSTSLDNVTVVVVGLKNELGQMKLHKSKVVELAKGVNVISFPYRVPTCSPCNRLKPRIYQIRATISRNGEVLAEGSGTVRLIK